jgi:hypothetical protein
VGRSEKESEGELYPCVAQAGLRMRPEWRVCGESQAPTRLSHPKAPIPHPTSTTSPARITSRSLPLPISQPPPPPFASPIPRAFNHLPYVQQWPWRWAWPPWPSPLPATRRSCAGPRPPTGARSRASSTGSATRSTRTRCGRPTSCSAGPTSRTTSLATARPRLLPKSLLPRPLPRRPGSTSSDSRSEHAVPMVSPFIFLYPSRLPGASDWMVKNSFGLSWIDCALVAW